LKYDGLDGCLLLAASSVVGVSDSELDGALKTQG